MKSVGETLEFVNVEQAPSLKILLLRSALFDAIDAQSQQTLEEQQWLKQQSQARMLPLNVLKAVAIKSHGTPRIVARLVQTSLALASTGKSVTRCPCLEVLNFKRAYQRCSEHKRPLKEMNRTN